MNLTTHIMEPAAKTDYSKMNMNTYEPATWRASKQPATAKDVAQLKKNVQAQNKELKQMLTSVIKSLPDHGKGLTDLADAWKSGDKDIKSELNAIRDAGRPRDVTAREAGMSFKEKQQYNDRLYEIENELFREKTKTPNNPEGFEPSSKNLRAIGATVGLFKNGQWVEGMNNTRMREMVLLDDLPSWLKTGVKALLPIADAFIPGASTLGNIALDVLGNPSGGIDHTTTKQASFEKITKAGPIVHDKGDILRADAMNTVDSGLHFTKPYLVDLPSISCTLVPEYFKEVVKYNDLQAAAVYTSFYEIPVIPTPGGTFFLVYNTNVDYVADNFDFITYTNSGNTYNPVTGAWTGTPTTIANPFIGNSAVDAVRLVGAALTYKPTILTNTQYANGQMDVYHDPGYNNAQGILNTPSPLLSLTNVGYRPFYQRGPIVQEYTQVFYNALDSENFTSLNNAINEGFSRPIVFMVSGANTAGVQIGTITVNLVWNVIPTSSGLSGLPMRLPGIGPFTSYIADALYAKWPQLYMADQETRMEVVQSLYGTQGDYSKILECLHGHKLKKKGVNAITGGPSH